MRQNLPKHPIKQMTLSVEGSTDWQIRITKRSNPALTFGTERKLSAKHSAFPISKDGAWTRYESMMKDDWTPRTCMVHRTDSDRYVAHIWLKKEIPMSTAKTVIGVDVGLRSAAAVTVFNPQTNKVMRQLYFGRNLLGKRMRLWKRKDKLRSKMRQGSKRAGRALYRLRRREHNLVNWNTYNIVHQIVKLAQQYHAAIAIENLVGLRRGNRKGRRLNRRLHSMPYHRFRFALEMVATRSGVPEGTVPARNTSKTCPRCGRVDAGNRPNGRTLFRCVKCGFMANSDRVASLNIARRYASLNKPVERTMFDLKQPNHCEKLGVDQFSTGGVPIDAPDRSNAEATIN